MGSWYDVGVRSMRAPSLRTIGDTSRNQARLSRLPPWVHLSECSLTQRRHPRWLGVVLVYREALSAVVVPDEGWTVDTSLALIRLHMMARLFPRNIAVVPETGNHLCGLLGSPPRNLNSIQQPQRIQRVSKNTVQGVVQLQRSIEQRNIGRHERLA